jgi:hypothetical protein
MDPTIKKIILDKKLKKYEKLSSILKYLFVDISNINQKKYYILGSFGLRKYRVINDLDINRKFYDLKIAIKYWRFSNICFKLICHFTIIYISSSF